MTRLPYPDLDDLMPRAAAAVDTFPVRLNVMRVAAHAESLFPGYMDMAKAMWGDLELAPRHRELLVMLVAYECDCPYEAAQHLAAAKAVGISQAELDTLAAGSDGEWADASDADLLDAGRQLLRTCTLTADTVTRLRSRFSDAEIVEIVLVTGYLRMVAGLLNGLDVEIDADGEALLSASKNPH